VLHVAKQGAGYTDYEVTHADMDGLLANLSPNTKAQTRSAQRGKTNFNQG
jgi:hypothetical protein